MTPSTRLSSSFVLVLVLAAAAFAQESPPPPEDAQKKIEELERRVRALEEALRKAEVSGAAAADAQKLEDEIDMLVARVDAMAQQPGSGVTGGGGPLRLIDISADGLFAAGTSTATDDEIAALEAGGHDPRQRGFSVQNVELTFAGAVDPYFRGDIHVVTFIDSEGETQLELEEAYLTTLALPGDLQLKGGHYFTEFGRINPRHPHEWDFVDQPVILSRVFGADGLRAPGARLSWLAPTPFFLELQTGMQNARGETVVSFLSSDEAGLPTGRPFTDQSISSLADFLYTERLAASFDLSDESTLSPGVSALFGPNSSGPDARTEIYGADLFYKWRALSNDQGWPFFSVQGEYVLRNYEAEEATDDDGNVVPGEDLVDQGFYVQALCGFERPWVAGLRFDYAEGEESDVLEESADPSRDRRYRISPNLTYYPSHFSKIRLQYNYDDSQFLSGDGSEHSVWLQFEFLFGAHGAHKF